MLKKDKNKTKYRLIFSEMILVTALAVIFLASCSSKGDIININESEADDPAPVTYDEETADTSTGTASDDEEPQEYEAAAVHVCGAVRNSGVYLLAAGSRTADAIEAAGGFSEDADEDYLNLASFVADGSKIYVPTVEESVSMPDPKASSEGFFNSNSHLININTADEKTLKTIAGIGDSRARDIINYRETHGEFKTVEDIMKVSGIKKKLFEKIKDLITV